MRITYKELGEYIGCTANTAKIILCREEFANIRQYRGYCFATEEEMYLVKEFYLNRHKNDWRMEKYGILKRWINPKNLRGGK